MKSILMSTHKKWVKAKQDGIKRYEIRKSAPPAPFKVYEYETLKDGGQGKIVQEWVCDRVDRIKSHGSGYHIDGESMAYTNKVAQESGLQFQDLKDYLGSKTGFALHITDLKIYDKPKELGEFRKPDTSCGFYNPDLERCDSGYNCERCVYNDLTITRPPQSWMYCEPPKDLEDKI